MIKELLDSRIRPAVQEDGGDIFFKCVPPALCSVAAPSRRTMAPSSFCGPRPR